MADTNWPGMTNRKLASILERGAVRMTKGERMTEHQAQALDEAIERIRERGDEEPEAIGYGVTLT